jgi:hypothetical protein
MGEGWLGSATVLQQHSVAGPLYHQIAVVVAAVPKMPAKARRSDVPHVWSCRREMLLAMLGLRLAGLQLVVWWDNNDYGRSAYPRR